MRTLETFYNKHHIEGVIGNESDAVIPSSAQQPIGDAVLMDEDIPDDYFNDCAVTDKGIKTKETNEEEIDDFSDCAL